MSTPPPGHPQGAPLSHEDAQAQNGNRRADDHVQYEFKLVKALRGRESSAKAKWQRQGWELVSENPGALRTELNFRRAKPKMIGDYLLGVVSGLRRLQPKTQSVLVASGALILVAGSVGFAVGTRSGGDPAPPTAAQNAALTAPPAEPTVTPTTVDELLDDAGSSTTSKPSERRAKARARARAKARARAREKRRERALDQERRHNTAQLQSGVTCAELGQSDVEVTPGAEIDGDGDGVGCES